MPNNANTAIAVHTARASLIGPAVIAIGLFAQFGAVAQQAAPQAAQPGQLGQVTPGAAPQAQRAAPPSSLPTLTPQQAAEQARSELPANLRGNLAVVGATAQNSQATYGAQAQRGASSSGANAAQGRVSSAPPMPSPSLDPGSLPNQVLDRVAPMPPDEIRYLRRQLQERQQAYVDNVDKAPIAKPVTTIYTLDTSPGATPPVIRVAAGQGTIISFLDAAGRPWPSRVAENFSPSTIAVSQFTEHQLSIAARSTVPLNAGIAVALKGLPLAITLTAVSGQSEVDRQVHLVLPKYVDDAPPAVGAVRGQPQLAVGELMAFLLRTPPPEARVLSVEGLPDAQAWQIDGSRMVIRTSALVVSGYFRSQGLGDGMSVYELPISPVVRTVEGGRMKQVRIHGLAVGGFGAPTSSAFSRAGQ